MYFLPCLDKFLSVGLPPKEVQRLINEMYMTECVNICVIYVPKHFQLKEY